MKFTQQKTILKAFNNDYEFMLKFRNILKRYQKF